MASSIKQLLSVDTNRFNPIDIPTDSYKYENDLLFEDLSDLVNSQFRSWYCKQFYRLGKKEVLRLAQTARVDSKVSPQRLFSHLLKKA